MPVILVRYAQRRRRQPDHTEWREYLPPGSIRARRFYEAGGWHPDGATKTDDSRGFPLTEVRYRHTGT